MNEPNENSTVMDVRLIDDNGHEIVFQFHHGNLWIVKNARTVAHFHYGPLFVSKFVDCAKQHALPLEPETEIERLKLR